jgi:hypothetical protein
MPDTVNVEIDLSDEDFMELARMAHEQNITLNQLCVNILQAYVDGKVEIPKEDIEEVALREATCSVVRDGVTVDTLKEYARAYLQWFEHGGCNGKTLGVIIQDGFDLADRKDKDAGRT